MGWGDTMRAFRLLGIASMVAAVSNVAAAQQHTLPVDLDAWWGAETPVELSEAATGILRSGASFEDVYAALSAGREYTAEVPRGRFEKTRRNQDGFLNRYLFFVPESYDPKRAYPVRLYLHGGISRPDPGGGGGWLRDSSRLRSEDYLVVAPLSWAESPWWQSRQVENIHGILEELKRTYNIDENRVHVMGVSDGATGVYFLAFRDPTPWSSFIPLIGSPAVLMNPSVRADGEMHIGNLKNRPMFIVNGERDRLYPVSSVRPWLDAFDKLDLEYEFHPHPGGHNLDWWPSQASNIERFAEAHARDPHPDRVVWGTESPDRYARAHWIVIDELGEIDSDTDRRALASWAATPESGILRATRRANTVVVDAYHVRRFRVLVSPEEFDLTSPVRVEVNGVVAFEGVVRQSVDTLLEWAGRDHDRTMLYAAEVEVVVGR